MRLMALVLVLGGCAGGDDNSRYPNPGPTGLQPTNTPILAAAGGTACIGQSTLCVFFPAGSISEDVTVAIRQASGVPTPAAVLASSAFDILFVPDTATFSGQATLTYQLPSTSLAGKSVGLAYNDAGAWAFDGISGFTHTVGTTLDVVNATTTHFTAFAVVDLDLLVGCACDLDATCSDGCACDADCCACDVDAACSVACACDPDCCGCDVDATCTDGCACDLDCCGCDVDATCTGGCMCDPDCIATDEPDVAVVYSDYEGPNVGLDCSAGQCTIPIGNALDFGTVAPLGIASAQLTLANRAMCTPIICDSCTLTVAPDPSSWNVGLGFVLNPDAAFSFSGSITTPFDIPQLDINCFQTGSINVLVQFQAPLFPGAYNGVIALESNDPDEAVIEIPVVGRVGSLPEAIAAVRSCPDSPCTNPDNIQPSDRVYFDGSGSFDPVGTIVGWDWQVVTYPAGVNPADLSPMGDTTSYFDFVVPAEGVYEVLLTVTNDSSAQSADTPEARVAVLVLGGSGDVSISLVWDTMTDQDLHMTFVDLDDRLCGNVFDCYYLNKTPLWFSGTSAGSGPNPHMDIDDTDGLGPENINIDTADDGTYRIYVHYWDNTGAATTATLNIVAGGTAYNYQRLLMPGEVWAAADIVAVGGGLVFVVQEYPTDGSGTGWVTPLTGSCEPPGWDFPF